MKGTLNFNPQNNHKNLIVSYINKGSLSYAVLLFLAVVAFGGCLFDTDPVQISLSSVAPNESGSVVFISSNQVYLSEGGKNTPRVISTDNLRKDKLALHPSYTQVMTLSGDDSLYVINFNKQSTPTLLYPYNHIACFDYVKGTYYYFLANDSLHILNPETIESIPSVTYPSGDNFSLKSLSLSSQFDISYVYLNHSTGNDTLIVKKNDNSGIVRRYWSSGNINRPDWAANASVMVFSVTGEGLYYWDVFVDPKPVKLLDDNASSYAISPSGMEVAYVLNNENKISIINLFKPAYNRHLLSVSAIKDVDWK